MATKQPDIKKLIENRIVTIDGQLDNLKAGTDEYSKAVKDFATVVRAHAEFEKVQVQAEDDKEKREEQKRMNDAELEFKEKQLEIDQTRADNEMEVRTKQTRITMGEVFMNAFLGIGSQYLYSRAWRRSYDAEYRISEGASMQLPRGVNDSVKGLMPKKRF